MMIIYKMQNYSSVHTHPSTLNNLGYKHYECKERLGSQINSYKVAYSAHQKACSFLVIIF